MLETMNLHISTATWPIHCCRLGDEALTLHGVWAKIIRRRHGELLCIHTDWFLKLVSPDRITHQQQSDKGYKWRDMVQGVVFNTFINCYECNLETPPPTFSESFIDRRLRIKDHSYFHFKPSGRTPPVEMSWQVHRGRLWLKCYQSNQLLQSAIKP